jgi:hypothetical protein
MLKQYTAEWSDTNRKIKMRTVKLANKPGLKP